MLAEAPTVDVVEQRLLAWAAWRTAGCNGDGFPTKSVLHPSWSPPSPGVVPAMRASSGGSAREREVDGVVSELSVKLRDALYVVYVKRMPADDQARALGCQHATVRARVLEAKRQIGIALRRGFTS